MPPYRRRKTYTRRRKTYKKKTTGWGNTAMKALKLATRVASMVNVEYKYIETDVTGPSITWNGSIYDALCLPAQGNTVNQREGDSIKMKTLTLEATIFRNTSDELVRLIIFLDKDNTITTPSSFWEGIGANNVVLADKNQDNKYKTKIIYDKTYIITQNSPLKKIKIVLPINKHLHFEKGSATAVTNNQLKMLIVGQKAAGGGGSTLSFHSHCSYIDN